MEQPTPRNVAEAQKILRNSRTVGRVRVDGILGRETLKAMLKFVKMGIENFPAGEYPASKADGEIYTDPTLMDTQSDIFKGASTKLPPKVKKPETKKILNENIPSSKKPPVSTTDND